VSLNEFLYIPGRIIAYSIAYFLLSKFPLGESYKVQNGGGSRIRHTISYISLFEKIFMEILTNIFNQINRWGRSCRACITIMISFCFWHFQNAPPSLLTRKILPGIHNFSPPTTTPKFANRNAINITRLFG